MSNNNILRLNKEPFFYCKKHGEKKYGGNCNEMCEENDMAFICNLPLIFTYPYYIKYECKNCGIIEKDIYDKEEICFNCGGEIKEIKENSYFGIGKYSSANSEKKREILKKRSNDHFKKELQEKFHEMNKSGFMP